ncbi:uncharacterized protein LODBEIA_P05830 [Lodderomyces beijingensis]|uniref:Uncharacterized protein n=1 Tax=Lodderomyces beijingensis TaxID=1775926 RepID=A0ABP0ZDU9_9ASCO
MSRVLGDLITGIIIAVLTYVSRFIHRITSSGNAPVLPAAGSSEPCASNYTSFFQPILEELVKLLIICYHSSKATAPLNLFDLSLMWVGYTMPTMQIYHYYCGKDYKNHYSKFLKYHELWLDQDLYRNRYDCEDVEEVEEFWRNIVDVGANTKDESSQLALRHSLSSEESGKTAVDKMAMTISRSMSYNVLPNEFKGRHDDDRKSFDTLVHDRVQSRKHSFASVKSTARPIPMNARNYMSCSDLVHKLYSLSPKNTYHLNRAVAIATFDDVEEESYLPQKFSQAGNQVGNQAEDQVENQAGLDILPEIEEVYENIDESFIQPNQEIAVEQSNEEQQTQHHNRTFLFALIQIMNWFSWLLPPFLPLNASNNGREELTSSMDPATSTSISTPIPAPNERYPLLKSSLSRYSLIPRESSSSPTRDLELGSGGTTAVIGVTTIDRVMLLQSFVSYYFDISLDSVLLHFKTDSWFMTYGQLIIDTRWWWVCLDELNYIVWQFVVVVMCLGLIVMKKTAAMAWLMLPLVLIPKLFKQNHLHNFNKKFDYRSVILLDGAINLGLLSFTTALSVFYE